MIDSMSFFGQLSTVFWLAFLTIALVRLIITIKDSRIFKPKN